MLFFLFCRENCSPLRPFILCTANGKGSVRRGFSNPHFSPTLKLFPVQTNSKMGPEENIRNTPSMPYHKVTCSHIISFTQGSPWQPKPHSGHRSAFPGRKLFPRRQRNGIIHLEKRRLVKLDTRNKGSILHHWRRHSRQDEWNPTKHRLEV